MRKCKRCGLKTVLSDEDIKKMVDEVRAMPGIRLVPDDVRDKRMAICTACDKLEYGSTCSLCGCIVHVRAMLSDGRCPYPKTPKWK